MFGASRGLHGILTLIVDGPNYPCTNNDRLGGSVSGFLYDPGMIRRATAAVHSAVPQGADAWAKCLLKVG